MVLVKKAVGGSVNSIRLCVVALQALLLKRRKTMTSYCSTRRLKALQRGLLTYLPQGNDLILFTKGPGVHGGRRPGQALHWKERGRGVTL